jgi:hypothetical protein
VNGAWGLAAVLLAAALATKVEGRVFVAAIVLSLVIVSERPSVGIRVIGVAALAGLVAVLPWQIWLTKHDIQGDYRFRFLNLEHPSHAAHAVVTLGHDLVSPNRWLLLPAVTAVVFVYAARSQRARRLAIFVSGSVLLSLAGLVMIYWGSSYPFQWYLSSSASRVVTTPLLLAATFSVLMLAHGDASEIPQRRNERQHVDTSPAPSEGEIDLVTRMSPAQET